MKNFWYLFSAYALIWVIIFSYILKLNGRIKEISLKIDRLISKE